MDGIHLSPGVIKLDFFIKDFVVSIAFLVFVLVIAAAIWMSFNRFLDATWSPRGKIVLLLWLAYAGLIGVSGLAARAQGFPPGPMLLVGPPLVFAVLALGRLKVGTALAAVIPLWVLTGAQGFRIVVEVFLHSLWLAGLAPQMLTYQGANFDMLVGLSAPFVAWMLARGAIGLTTLWLWNVFGLMMLANIAVRALLTAPGPLNLIHTLPPNLVVSTFPYTFIPGFLAPLALMLHVLSFRAIRLARQQLESAPASPVSANYSSGRCRTPRKLMCRVATGPMRAKCSSRIAGRRRSGWSIRC